MPAAPRKLTGRTTPRIWTPPLRPLNKRTTRGFQCADFADHAGEPFMPWQRWLAIHALETIPGGDYRFRIVLVLVARQNGKSSAKRTITLWRMCMTPRFRVLGVAQEVGQAREQWELTQETIHDSPRLEAEFRHARNSNGTEAFFLTNGSRYKIGAMSRKAGRGLSNDEVNIDELREQRDWRAWGALSKTTMARVNSQIWCMSNAGDDESVVLNQLREAALAGRDESIGLFEWSAEDDCDPADPRAWAQANPGLGYVISPAAIRTALATDPPAVFRTEVLCQRVDSLDSAIDLLAWKDCADPAGDMSAYRDRVAACFDVSPDEGHCALLVAARTDSGRVRLEVARAWQSTDDARDDIGPLLAAIRPRAFGWFSAGPAAALGPVLRPLAVRYNKRYGQPRDPGEIPEDGEITGRRVTEACQGLSDLVRGRRVIHPNDPLLNAHVAGAQKLYSGDGWRFTRKSGHVNAAYAAAGAADIALTMPAARKAVFRVISY